MNDFEIQHIGQLALPSDDPEYVRLVSHISNLWEDAKAKKQLNLYSINYGKFIR